MKKILILIILFTFNAYANNNIQNYIHPNWLWDHHVKCSNWVYDSTDYFCTYVIGECSSINNYDCLTRIREDIYVKHCVKYDEEGSIIEEYDQYNNRRYRVGCCNICTLIHPINNYQFKILNNQFIIRR